MSFFFPILMKCLDPGWPGPNRFLSLIMFLFRYLVKTTAGIKAYFIHIPELWNCWNWFSCLDSFIVTVKLPVKGSTNPIRRRQRGWKVISEWPVIFSSQLQRTRVSPPLVQFYLGTEPERLFSEIYWPQVLEWGRMQVDQSYSNISRHQALICIQSWGVGWMRDDSTL